MNDVWLTLKGKSMTYKSTIRQTLKECLKTIKNTADYLEETANGEADEIRASNLQWAAQTLENLYKEMGEV